MAPDKAAPEDAAVSDVLANVATFLSDAAASNAKFGVTTKDLNQFEACRAIFDAPIAARMPAIPMIIKDAYTTKTTHRGDSYERMFRRLEAGQALLAEILRRGDAATTDHFCLSAVEQLKGEDRAGLYQHWAWDLPWTAAIELMEKRALARAFPPESAACLRKLCGMLARLLSGYAEHRRLGERLEVLATGAKPGLLDPGDVWADKALADLAAMPAEGRKAWETLITFAATAKSAKPAKKWLKEAGSFIERIGSGSFSSTVQPWFALVGQKGKRLMAEFPQVLAEQNAAVLKGLAWACSDQADQELNKAVSALAEACFKKVPNHGPLHSGVGNACLVAVAAMPLKEAASQLTNLGARVQHFSSKRQVARALDSAASRVGLTADDLADQSVPDFGMQEPGLLQQKIGGNTAMLRVVGTGVELTWHDAKGKETARPPAGLKNGAPELKALQKTITEIRKALSGQRARIEHAFLRQRDWALHQWRKLYIDHPLMATLARRLIWHFQKGEQKDQGIWSDGKLVGANGKPLDWLDAETRVSLWHPLGSDVQTVLAWRTWLEKHEVRQPFKQAHREIYVLTDAELQTGTYSNRFAAHIIRQHQFAQLCQQRGWRYRLLGNWGSGDDDPRLDLPKWKLKAEFQVGMAGDGTDLSGTGVWMLLSTDQVRFLNRAGERVPLSEVPALVFSEVMRDVDLFVGVCSVGNDPNWADRGEGGYWHRYSFGDLSDSAKTRKALLEQLIAKLQIAPRCSFQDRFLVVRGDLRTYKIHLGSGNILMEPNDQYLCIVEDRAGASKVDGRVFLPFEGDELLSVILSKALLLANDSKIKDRTILRQIQSTK